MNTTMKEVKRRIAACETPREVKGATFQPHTMRIVAYLTCGHLISMDALKDNREYVKKGARVHCDICAGYEHPGMNGRLVQTGGLVVPII